MADRKFARLHTILGALVCLLAAGASPAADKVNLRVAYIEGPAANAILAGRIDDAIAYLEQRISLPENSTLDELSSLCAAHVLNRDFKAAKAVCDHAVEKDASALAYNNRGVLRAHLGDLNGSIDDFAKIRVLQHEYARYISQMTEGNARIMATRNFEMVRRLKSPGDDTASSLSSSQVRGAEIEDPASAH